MQAISTRGWSFDKLLAKASHFKPVPRVSCTTQDLEKVIEEYEEGDVPLVIEGWHQTSSWPKNIFNIDFCRRYFGGEDQKISARNVHTRSDKSMAFDEFVEKSRTVSAFAEPEETERWYGKDVECPPKWEEWLLNEHVIPAKLTPEGGNDLLAIRPKKNGRPDIETLMCYFGVADTYTPCHKDQCASSGQNLMCYTEKEGSSFWFMTKGSDCTKVAEYFRTLKQVLDHETHIISVPELGKAPFDVYIVEQKLGDLVLVPPRSCHQVVNSGGMTIKMSWSRMTIPGLTAALYHELPLYRRICRPETYQIRSTIYYALCDYTQKLKALVTQPFDPIQRSVLTKRLTTVLRLYDRILFEEYSPYGDSPVSSRAGSRSWEEEESLTQSSELSEDFQTCDFCGADIFQSYFQCCGPSISEAGFIICPGCYAEGRTCACEEMNQKQRQKFSALFAARWEALETLKDTGNPVKSSKGLESPEQQESFFSHATKYSIFHAAMLLHRTRTNQRQFSRACRNGYGSTHSVPSIWALGCKKCHSSKCFPHLLEVSRMHSVRALLLQERDQSHATYHSRHVAKFPEYNDRKEAFLVAQKEGSASPDFNVQLVYNVSTFTVCQPVNTAHASLGWYDTLPPKPKIKHDTSQSQFSSAGTNQPEDTFRSPTNSSQRSVKNHAYVEVKPPKRHQVAATPSRNLPRQLSTSPLSSDFDDSDDEELNPRVPNSPKKTTQRPLSRGPSSSRDESSKPRRNVTLPSRSHLIKGTQAPQPGPNSGGTILETVYPIGPPRKKRRHESDSRGTLMRANAKPKTEEPNAFAAALGAAINQVATTATRTSSSSAQKHRQKSNNIENRPNDNLATTIPTVANPNTQQKSAPEGPILVNVMELQDMVLRTAERVVSQMIGETPLSASLTTNAAGSMMAAYATAGLFVNKSTQMQFRSVDHFAETAPQAKGNAVGHGSSSSHQRLSQASTRSSGVNSKGGHPPPQPISRPHDTRTKDCGKATYPPLRKRPAPSRSSNAAASSNDKKRRVPDSDDNDEV